MKKCHAYLGCTERSETRTLRERDLNVVTKDPQTVNQSDPFHVMNEDGFHKATQLGAVAYTFITLDLSLIGEEPKDVEGKKRAPLKPLALLSLDDSQSLLPKILRHALLCT